jgi:hypothetical protein
LKILFWYLKNSKGGKMIRDYDEGAKVMITEKNLNQMKNGNKSIHNFPCDSFIKKAESVKGHVGTVTKRFMPGYEFNVEWKTGEVLQMKDHWVEPLDNNWEER